MRFLIDEDVHECLKFILAEWKHEADHVKLRPELGAEPDAVILATATSENRVIITYNTADYEGLHDHYRRQGQNHAGIICCRKLDGYRNFDRILAWMANLLKTEDEVTLRNRVCYLHSY